MHVQLPNFDSGQTKFGLHIEKEYVFFGGGVTKEKENRE